MIPINNNCSAAAPNNNPSLLSADSIDRNANGQTKI